MYYKAYIIMIIVRLRISQYLLRLNYVNYSLGMSAVLLNEGMVMQHLDRISDRYRIDQGFTIHSAPR